MGNTTACTAGYPLELYLDGRRWPVTAEMHEMDEIKESKGLAFLFWAAFIGIVVFVLTSAGFVR